MDEYGITALVLTGFRAFGFVLLLPFGEGFHALVSRIFVALGLAALLVPPAAVFSASPLAIVGNVLFGVLLSLPIVLLLEAVAMAGELLDVARGQTIAQVYDPLQHSVTSPLAVAGRQLAWMSLLLFRGEESLLHPLAHTMKLIGVGEPLSFLSLHTAWSLFEECAQILAACLRIILPLLLVFFLMEAIFGVVAKVGARTSLHTESSLAKLLAGAVLLLAIWRGGGLQSLFPLLRTPFG